MKRALLLAFPLFILAAWPGGAKAACDPPRLVNDIQMRGVPFGVDSQVELVPVSLNGQDTEFVLDTGGIHTQISASLAAAMGLPVNRSGEALKDVTGREAAGLTMIRQFRLGTQTRQDVPLPLSPATVIRTGLLSLDDLSAYDVDLDFASNHMRFYAPGHCPAADPAATAIPFSLSAGHIQVSVKLNGRDIPAILDTGASDTDMRADIAQLQFGAIPGGVGTPESGLVNGMAGIVTHVHFFDSLTVGGITIDQPRVTILPATYQRDGQTVTLQAPELILGMNMLRRFHLYFDFAQSKLYVSPATGAAPP